MKWVNFLHFYQPANQQKDILEAVVNQCYRPLIKGFLKRGATRLTINVSGSLLELLDKYGFNDVTEGIRELYRADKVEITSTACYHAFLPLINEEEIDRQIELNNDLVRSHIDPHVQFDGFFPPEMGISKTLCERLIKKGYKYVLVDSIAYKCNTHTIDEINGRKLFFYHDSNLRVFFRDRRPSNILMSGIERNSKSISDLLSEYANRDYLITAMDGETFGHHRPGLDAALLDIYDVSRTHNSEDSIEYATISDLLFLGLESCSVGIQSSTWASSIEDIEKNIQFISWKDPENMVHNYQWELVNLMLKVVYGSEGSKNYGVMREKADKALASDQFFWASAKPWWSIEMIESGSYQCMEVVEMAERRFKAEKKLAQELYRKIISTAFEWQRSGKIREMNKERNLAQRIPFKTRTLEGGGVEPAVYQAFIDLLRRQERLAAQSGEYEKAILWRDALYKIETKNDIYDAIHAVDMLRFEVPEERINRVIDQYTEEYRKLRGGQPEQRSN